MIIRTEIAVIDDDENVRAALDSLLRSCGHIVHVFGDAHKFLEAGIASHVDCIVSDIQMPGMNGLQMFQQLLSEGLKTPVVFITASNEDGPRLAAAKLGASCYLSKPFDGQTLLDCIESSIKGAEQY